MSSLTSDLARLANNANVLVSAITTNGSAITAISVGGSTINASGMSGVANNTSYVGSVEAANVVSNAQLQANLSNYLPLTGGTISGNLIITGTTVTVNTTTLDVKDLNITVAKGAGSAAAANGAGITVDSGYANLYYSSSANAWTSTVGFGVGTVPSTKFHIYGSNNDTLSRLEVSNTTYTAQYHINRGSGKDTYIGPATNNSYVDFWTYENLPIRFGSNNADIMRLCSNGNVGIACTAPGASLEVYGKIRCPVDTSVGYFDIGSFGSYIGRNSGDGATYFNYAQAPLYFKAGGTDTVIFSSNGNVGIGNTAPQSKLTVNGSGFFNGITLSNTAGIDIGYNTNYSFISSGNRGAGTLSRLDLEGSSFDWLFGFGTSLQMRLNSTGLGIGGSPSYKLDVQSSSPAFLARIYNSNTTTASTINADNFMLFENHYGITQISNWANLGMRIGSRQIKNGGNGHIYFTTAGDSVTGFLGANGNFGLGTTEPVAGIEVNRASEIGSIVHWPSNARGGIWALSGQRFAISTTNTSDDILLGYLDVSVANSFVEQARLDTSTGNFKIGGGAGILPTEILEIYKSGGGGSIRWHSPNVAEYKAGIAAGETLFRLGTTPGNASQGSVNHLTMTNSGRVGIHTTSQGNYNLFVQTDNGNYAPMKISGPGTQAWGIGLIVETTGGTDGAGIVWRSRGTKNWQIRGETNSNGFQICEDGGDASAGSEFGTPRIHIRAGGSTMFGTTSTTNFNDAAGALQITTGGTTAARAVICMGSSATAAQNWHMVMADNNYSVNFYNGNYGAGVTKMYIKTDGGIANFSGSNVNLSDERVKKNITLAGSYLEKICSIPVKNFKYKDEGAGTRTLLGVIAQDVEAIAPELVDNSGFSNDTMLVEGEEPMKSVYQTDITFALMKALQELKEEFDKYKETHP